MSKLIIIDRCWDCKFLSGSDAGEFMCTLTDDLILVDVMSDIPKDCKLPG